MCGIAVAIGWPEAEASVKQLIAGLLHRGDVTDPVLSPTANTAMCTRRLRIVDGEGASQPQGSFDGQLFISFNGEIYNHAALRDELAALGVPFRSGSDTEVLANALRVWGYKALERICGMYAFVAFEPASGEFLAARDPFGIKPLYLIQDGGGFLFCSEIRPLLDTVETGDVLVLPPGHLLTSQTCAKFVAPFNPPAEELQEGSVETLDKLLAEAVRIRMPPDLPVAVLFSGGIDSTLVAHYARQFDPKSPGYFVGSETAPDLPFALDYADRSGLDLRMVPFEPESDETFALIDQAVAVNESFEPNLMRAAVCSLLVSQKMHEDGYRVALCGEGADELFCGYAPLELTFQDGNDIGRPVRDECLAMMARVSLQRVDRSSMRYQLETRVPFLDLKVASYALKLDARALVAENGGAPLGKAALRALYDLYPEQLPTSIRDRGKVPMGDGCGLDVNPDDSKWKSLFHEAISDRAFEDGQKEFADFAPQTKEELFYLRKLSDRMDVRRVPHLRDRAWLSASLERYHDKLTPYFL
jgi:asparagine synthase (glutamine-hydrolysing)